MSGRGIIRWRMMKRMERGGGEGFEFECLEIFAACVCVCGYYLTWYDDLDL